MTLEAKGVFGRNSQRGHIHRNTSRSLNPIVTVGADYPQTVRPLCRRGNTDGETGGTKSCLPKPDATPVSFPEALSPTQTRRLPSWGRDAGAVLAVPHVCPRGVPRAPLPAGPRGSPWKRKSRPRPCPEGHLQGGLRRVRTVPQPKCRQWRTAPERRAGGRSVA